MNSTLDEKIMIKKYYYKCQFNSNLTSQELQIGWDENYIFFQTN